MIIRQLPYQKVIQYLPFTRLRPNTALAFSSTSNNPTKPQQQQPPVKTLSITRTKTWERSAKLVKNTNVKTQYLEQIRQVHDPNQHIKTLEEELMGAMAEALRKQSDKLYMHFKTLKDYHDIYKNPKYSRRKRQAACKNFNIVREKAQIAKWELIVHRQAIGFVIKNHDVVNEMFPIPQPLNDDIENDDDGHGHGFDDDEGDEFLEQRQKSNLSMQLYERVIGSTKY